MDNKKRRIKNQGYINNDNSKVPTQGPVSEKSNDPYQKYKDFKWQNPERFNNGPVGHDNRKCRDCICCIIALVFFAACAFVGTLGFMKGNPTAILYTYDEDGYACGHSPGYEDYPYLYFYSVVSAAATFDKDKILNGVCVKDCPNEKLKKSDFSSPNVYYHLNCHGTEKNPDCHITYADYYESKGILNRLCFPKSNDELKFAARYLQIMEIYEAQAGEIFK